MKVNRNTLSILLFTLGWIGFSQLLCAQTNPASLNWTSPTDGILFSSPTIDSSGKIYIGSNDNKLHAISSLDGSTAWTFTTGNWVDSTPAMSHDESVVYFGSWDNKLYAVNSQTGTEIWSFETNSYIQSSPAVGLDGKIYFGSMDSIFYALEANGSLSWQYFVGEPIFSSPAIGPDGTLYFGDENGTFHALNSDGSEKWTYLVDEVTDTNQSILSSPALDGEGNIYFGSGNGYCYSLSDDGTQASLNWKYLTSDRVDASPALGLDDEVFFVSRDGYMRSLPLFSPSTDNVANWEVFVGDVFYSSPVVDENGRVYVIGYTGGGENHLFAYDENGTKAWDSNVSSPPFEIPSVVDSSLLLSDAGDLYFGCFDKNLYSIELGVGPAASNWPMFGRTPSRNSDWPAQELTISISNSRGGTVSGGGTYYKESSADINATPDTGYSFAGWNGDGVANPDSSSTIVSMTQDRSVAATFSINSYDLSLSAGEGGSVTGGGSYTYDSDADINATPNTGYSFAGWDGDGVASPGSSSTTVSMTQSRSVAATFTINSYDLTLSAGDGGSVSGGGSFTYGSAADINATPNTGYSFAGWNGDGVNDSTTANTFVSITQNQSVSASFSINSYDLTLSAGDGGSVTGGGSYTYGSDATITATPDTGYSFAGWTGDGIANSASASTTVSMAQDRSATATFTINSYDLTLSAGDGGSVSGGGSFTYGSTADINATPDTGYSFAGWNGDGVANPDSSSTIVSMTQDRSVAATFSINSYDLSLSAGEGGSVTGGGSYTYDSDADINATPNTGYSFAGWDGDGVASPGSSSTTVSMTQSRSVAATFTINSYDLTLSAGDGGSVSGGGSFTYGSAADINATPNTGYSFAGWNGDGVNDSTTANTFVSITQNQSVSASFSINSYDLTLSAGDGGSVTGGGSYTYGSDATITATPDTGYSFAGWLGEGMEDSNSLSTSVSMTQDRILTASFTPREIDRYLLVISSLPSSAGVTSGAEEYEDESNVSITATAATGYSFTGWTGDGITNPNLASTSVFMDQDRNITANFATNFYDLNLSAGEGGTVSDGGRFPYNSTADISATPDMGYSFAGWNGSGVATPNSSSTTVSMIQDRYISASFSINSYILNLSSGTGGSVSGAGTYTYGSIINISATPKTGYSFTGWTGSGISDFGSASTSVSITQDRNISATFSINSYLLSLSSGDGGSVSGSGSFLYGTSADINATPNTGYSFAGWSGNGVATPNSISTTVSMTQNRSISAAFSLNSYTLALSAGTGGTVSNGGSYSYGASVTITATPSTGYSFAGWSGDGVASPSSATSSVSITQDRNLTAYFTKDLHTLSISTPEGGTVNDSGTHEFGSNVGLVAEADTGYAFSHWEGSLVATPNSASTSILLTKNSSVKAIFERLPGFWNQSWMGWVLQNDKNWLYHYPLGWMYSSSAKTSNDYWLWHPELQWVWLEREAFPKSQVWMNTKQSWIFLKIENANNFRYYDYIEKRWISF